MKGGDLQSGQERGRRLQKRGPGVLKKMKKSNTTGGAITRSGKDTSDLSEALAKIYDGRAVAKVVLKNLVGRLQNRGLLTVAP